MTESKLSRIVGALVLICCLIACGAADAAGNKQQVSYYLLIDNTVNADFSPQDSLPELLKGFSFLHPDYADVSFQIYKIINTEKPAEVNNPFEFLYGGSIDGEGDIQQLSNRLRLIGSRPESNSSRVSMDDLYSEIDAKENHSIIYLGSLTQKKVDSLKNNFISIHEESPYVIVNTTKGLKADDDLHYLEIEMNDTVTSACKIYETIALPGYDQELKLVHTSGKNASFPTYENDQEVKIVAPCGSYERPDVSNDYEGSRISLIKMEAGKSEYSLNLVDDGEEKVFAVSELHQPYEYADLSGLESTHTMRDSLSLSGSIRIRDKESTPYILSPEDWKVEIKLIDAEGREETFPDESLSKDGTFICNRELRNIAGDYTVKIQARNYKEPWFTLPQIEMGNLTVSNQAPSVLENNRIELAIWKNGPVKIENNSMVDLSSFFTDDGYIEDLRYYLEEDHPDWMDIRDHQLYIDENKINQSGSATIYAEDAKGLRSSGLTVDVVFYDADVLLAGADCLLQISSSDEDGIIYRDSEVNARAVLTLPESAGIYLNQLAKEEKTEAFVSLIQGTFTVDDATQKAEVYPDGENPLKFSFETSYKKLWKSDTDQFASQFTATIDGYNDVYAETSFSFAVEDRIPVVNSDLLLSRYDREVPGPWILNSFVSQDKREVLLSFSELLRTEEDDTITVTVYGDDSTKLYKNGSDYYFTDEELPDAESVSEIVWDTNAEQSPVLHLWKTEHGIWQASVRIRDDKQNEATGSPFELVVRNQYPNEELMILIAMIAIGLMVLAIVIAVIHQIRKPKFRDDDVLKIDCNGFSSTLPLVSWGKKGITLRELVLYSGAPVIGIMPWKRLEKVILKAGRKDKRLVLVGKGKADLTVRVNGTIQERNRIPLYEDSQTEIELNDETMISLHIQEE